MFYTLRSKLILFFSCVTFVPLILVGIVMYLHQKDNLSSQMEETLMLLSRSRAESLEDFLSERKSNLERFALDSTIRDVEADEEAIRSELLAFQSSYPYFLDVMLITNQQVVSIHKQESISDLLFESPFQITDSELITLEDSTMLFPREPTFIMSQSVYNHQDELIGRLAGFVDVTEVRKKLNHPNFTHIEMDRTDYAFLINHQGEFISHPNRELVLHNNYFEMNDFGDGEFQELVDSGEAYFNPTNQMIQFFHEIRSQEDESSWFVGVSVPQHQLETPQQYLLITYLALFTFVFLVTLFAVFKLSHFIVIPIEKLVIATANFTFRKKVEPLTYGYYQEADTLSRAFKMMTAKLIEREQILQKSSLIVETTDNGVFAFTKKDQLITTFNSSCERLFHVRREEVLGVSLQTAASNHKRLKAFLNGANIIEKGEHVSRYECTCILDKQPYTFFVSVSRLEGDCSPDSVEQDTLVVFNDVTEKRMMQQQLLRSEKSKAVGELAAGFAHEIRNPLSTIKGFLQLFEKDEKDQGKKDQFELLVREIDRVNHIIKDLLNMASPSEVNRKETDISQILQDTEQMYYTEALAKNIELSMFVDNIPHAWVDANKVQQIIINLVRNAIEAMPKGGKLNIHALAKDEGVIDIIIQDTGVGMSKQTLERIGTPFFTTKNQGTGLGLMTCFRIAEELEGSLVVKSEEDAGTTFTLSLPIYTT
ncbi:sensor histidine kinase [Alkalicoccobacillus porphyridii]|uniref:histidine kinase n=1 Tax=Alkalicoccobacillus porphyridii TaxID=2597270 RepID=A0A553ZW40_9BACI|nr:sensor histidine kinase [Alkalicoccobacillus porphyridii]TSB45677.1 hypothetical protein FN960_14400 [Alkalicoccobacillus porphyridii]